MWRFRCGGGLCCETMFHVEHFALTIHPSTSLGVNRLPSFAKATEGCARYRPPSRIRSHRPRTSNAHNRWLWSPLPEK